MTAALPIRREAVRAALIPLRRRAGRGFLRKQLRASRMYVYDEFDSTFIAERAAQFRDQVARRLSGELTEDEFKPLRLMNGVYLQLHAYMLRIAIPYGTLFLEPTAEACACRARLRPRLRAFHDAAEPPAQLDQAVGHAGRNRRAGRRLASTPSRPPAIASATSHRSMGGRCARRDRRPAALGGDPAPMVYAAPGIHVPAAQIQDRDHGARLTTGRR